MSKNAEVQKFVAEATQQDWQDLAALINSAKYRSKVLPTADGRFNFTYGAIAPYLEERGLITRTKRKNPEENEELKDQEGRKMFLVLNYKSDATKTSRSVQIDDAIYTRLTALWNNNGQYTHAAVLNQLLDDALKIYGY